VSALWENCVGYNLSDAIKKMFDKLQLKNGRHWCLWCSCQEIGTMNLIQIIMSSYQCCVVIWFFK
jgi:hypothetical protein